MPRSSRLTTRPSESVPTPCQARNGRSVNQPSLFLQFGPSVASWKATSAALSRLRTVIRELPWASPALATIVVSPSPNAVTTPARTLATETSLVVQVTETPVIGLPY